MIKDTVTKKGRPAITSDRWHVVHSQFRRKGKSAKPFERSIISEHDDQSTCRKAARALRARLDQDQATPLAQRDEVFVRRPNYKSLKTTRQRVRAKE
jgi:hypothetical protein